MDINTVTVVGRLTKDPELKKTASGKSVCTFTLAVNRRGQDTADFIQCVVWNQSAEFLGTYGHKGQVCGVVGRIQTRTYEERDGSKKYVVEVLGNYTELINDGGKKGNSTSYEEPAFDTGKTSVDISPDDLPF